MISAELRKPTAAAGTVAAPDTGTAADVLARTAETYLAETRIALALARRKAGEGQDRLKLLLNDESVSVWSDTRLVLLTEPVDPPAGITGTLTSQSLQENRKRQMRR